MTNKYIRQINCERIGERGQDDLRNAKVLLIGCGGLGTAVAESLVRMGIGSLHIIDRDVVEEVNLHRQQLFTVGDIGSPKAPIAALHLCDINPDVHVTTEIRDWAGSFGGSYNLLVDGTDNFSYNLIIDGTDNFETRYLINDYAASLGIPWIYGGVDGVHGMVMPIIPGKTPCFRCLWPKPPSKDRAGKTGILPPVVSIIASMQVIEAIRILTGQFEKTELVQIDVWTGKVTRLQVESDPDCNCRKTQ